jgi:hypothetical protein
MQHLTACCNPLEARFHEGSGHRLEAGQRPPTEGDAACGRGHVGRERGGATTIRERPTLLQWAPLPALIGDCPPWPTPHRRSPPPPHDGPTAPNALESAKGRSRHTHGSETEVEPLGAADAWPTPRCACALGHASEKRTGDPTRQRFWRYAAIASCAIPTGASINSGHSSDSG